MESERRSPQTVIQVPAAGSAEEEVLQREATVPGGSRKSTPPGGPPGLSTIIFTLLEQALLKDGWILGVHGHPQPCPESPCKATTLEFLNLAPKHNQVSSALPLKQFR